MHPDLTAIVMHGPDLLVVNLVARAHEVPRRTVSVRSLRCAEQVHLAVPRVRFHVVGQHESPGPAGRPQVEERHRGGGQIGDHIEQPPVEVMQAVLDRPGREGRGGLHPGETTPQPELDHAGHGRTGQVIAAHDDGPAGSGDGRTADLQIPFRPVQPHHLAGIERQEDVALGIPPDRGHPLAVGGVNGFGCTPAPAGLPEHRRDSRIRHHMPEEGDVSQPVAAQPAAALWMADLVSLPAQNRERGAWAERAAVLSTWTNLAAPA